MVRTAGSKPSAVMVMWAEPGRAEAAFPYPALVRELPPSFDPFAARTMLRVNGTGNEAKMSRMKIAVRDSHVFIVPTLKGQEAEFFSFL